MGRDEFEYLLGTDKAVKANRVFASRCGTVCYSEDTKSLVKVYREIIDILEVELKPHIMQQTPFRCVASAGKGAGTVLSSCIEYAHALYFS